MHYEFALLFLIITADQMNGGRNYFEAAQGKSSESVQCAMLKAVTHAQTCYAMILANFRVLIQSRCHLV